MLKSVSAFANSSGGTLIWGISNENEIVGLEDAESDAEFISETIKTKIDSMPNINLRFHIDKIELGIVNEINTENELLSISILEDEIWHPALLREGKRRRTPMLQWYL